VCRPPDADVCTSYSSAAHLHDPVQCRPGAPAARASVARPPPAADDLPRPRVVLRICPLCFDYCRCPGWRAPPRRGSADAAVRVTWDLVAVSSCPPSSRSRGRWHPRVWRSAAVRARSAVGSWWRLVSRSPLACSTLDSVNSLPAARPCRRAAPRPDSDRALIRRRPAPPGPVCPAGAGRRRHTRRRSDHRTHQRGGPRIRCSAVVHELRFPVLRQLPRSCRSVPGWACARLVSACDCSEPGRDGLVEGVLAVTGPRSFQLVRHVRCHLVTWASRIRAPSVHFAYPPAPERAHLLVRARHPSRASRHPLRSTHSVPLAGLRSESNTARRLSAASSAPGSPRSRRHSLRGRTGRAAHSLKPPSRPRPATSSYLPIETRRAAHHHPTGRPDEVPPAFATPSRPLRPRRPTSDGTRRPT